MILKAYIFNAINSLPNKIILHQSDLKAFIGKKVNVASELNFFLRGVRNIVGKGESAGNHHFLLFLQCFKTASFSRSLKVEVV